MCIRQHDVLHPKAKDLQLKSRGAGWTMMLPPGDSSNQIVDMSGEYGPIHIAHVIWGTRGTIVVEG
jgi:hypothetical protein